MCVTAPKSALPDPDSAGKPEGSATDSLRVRTRLLASPRCSVRVHLCNADQGTSASASTRISSRMPRSRSCAEAACSCCLFLQRTTSRNKPRAGWLRSLYNLFGLGKRQEMASILAAVNAATPVGHTRADRAGTRRWTRGSIEREDLAL